MPDAVQALQAPFRLLDAPPPKLVTPEILKEARSKTDVQVKRYDTMTVDFVSGISNEPADPQSLQRPAKICDSALDLVGHTPMVRLTRLAQKYGLKCDLGGLKYSKCSISKNSS